MNFSFQSSVSSTARAWCEAAIQLCAYPLDKLDIDVAVEAVAEPPCVGHQDYMCTSSGSETVIHVRTGIEDPAHPMNAGLPDPARDTRAFFIESFVHELGHVVAFHLITTDAQRTQAAALFRRAGATGEGLRTGTLADWNPLDKPWEDRIQEAVAEVFKDAWLDDALRVYEQRANWEVVDFSQLVIMLIPPPSPALELHGDQVELLPFWAPWDDLELSGPQVSPTLKSDGIFHQPLRSNGDQEALAWVGPADTYSAGKVVVRGTPIYVGPGPTRVALSAGGFINWEADFTMEEDWSRAIKEFPGGGTEPMRDAPYYGWGGPFLTNPFMPPDGPPTLRVRWVSTTPNTGISGIPEEYESTFVGLKGGGQVKILPDLRDLGFSEDSAMGLQVELWNVGVRIYYYEWWQATDANGNDIEGPSQYGYLKDWFYDYERPDVFDTGKWGPYRFPYSPLEIVPSGPGVTDNWRQRDWRIWRPEGDPIPPPLDPYVPASISADPAEVAVYRYSTAARM